MSFSDEGVTLPVRLHRDRKRIRPEPSRNALRNHRTTAQRSDVYSSARLGA